MSPDLVFNLILGGGVVLSLLARQRFAEAAAFSAVIACFVSPLAAPLASALSALKSAPTNSRNLSRARTATSKPFRCGWSAPSACVRRSSSTTG